MFYPTLQGLCEVQAGGGPGRTVMMVVVFVVFDMNVDSPWLVFDMNVDSPWPKFVLSFHTSDTRIGYKKRPWPIIRHKSLLAGARAVAV